MRVFEEVKIFYNSHWPLAIINSSSQRWLCKFIWKVLFVILIFFLHFILGECGTVSVQVGEQNDSHLHGTQHWKIRLVGIISQVIGIMPQFNIQCTHLCTYVVCVREFTCSAIKRILINPYIFMFASIH